MTDDVVSVAPEASVESIARLLLERRISAVPVIGTCGIYGLGSFPRHRRARWSPSPSWRMPPSSWASCARPAPAGPRALRVVSDFLLDHVSRRRLPAWPSLLYFDQVNFIGWPKIIMTSMIPPGLLRRVIAAFGLFAALMLVLQPVCSAYESAHETQGTPCCVDIPVDSFASSPSTENPKAAIPVLAISPALSAAPVAVALPLHRLDAWNGPAPPPLPYHARSARIQR